jgi:two-component system, cell cycle response regulator DivK
MERKRVLVVDDDADQRDIYVTILRFHGYEILEAGDGEAAVRCALRERPHVVLMDAALPGMDGWEATERLKAARETASIPVIMITAHALEADRQRGADMGVDRFLAKPCVPDEMLEEVRRLIGPAEEPAVS